MALLQLPNGAPQSSLTRACKIFISIDDEGLLFDAISISDVAEFDCYESIMRSARRIIAMFQNLKESEILVDRMFYYKRRVRSNRMNPMPLLTTTDGFRAIAEHPSGEVPIGVHWSKSDTKTNTEKAKKTDANSESPPVVIKMEVEKDADDNASSSTESLVKNVAATSMANVPTTTATPQPNMISLVRLLNSSTAPSSAGVTVTTTTPQETNTSHEPVIKRPPTAFGKTYKPRTMYPEVDPVVSSSQRVTTAEYDHSSLFPTQATAEVVIHFEGISERHPMPNSLKSVLLRLANRDYTVLRNDIARHLEIGKKPVDEPTSTSNKRVGSGDPNKMIQYLKDAKMEIFRVLSRTSLSQARFQDLLQWMKGLELEDGTQGKFFLSERNTIGTEGLRVSYDTDKQAAMRFEALQQMRARQPEILTLYPNQLSVPGAPSMVTVGGNIPHTVNSMEQSGPEDLPSVVLSDGTVLVPVIGKQIVAKDLQKQQQSEQQPQQDQQPQQQVLLPVSANKGTDLPPESLLPLKSKKTNQNQAKSITPKRNKRPGSSDPDEPVPVKMFKSRHLDGDKLAEDDQEHPKHSYRFRERKPLRTKVVDDTSDTDSVVTESEDEKSAGTNESVEIPMRIKQEPLDYNGEEANPFNQEASPSNMVTGDHDNNEHEFDFVIKTEPLDEFDYINT